MHHIQTYEVFYMGRKPKNKRIDVSDLKSEDGKYYCDACGEEISAKKNTIKYQDIFINIGANIKRICHQDCKYEMAKKLRNEMNIDE